MADLWLLILCTVAIMPSQGSGAPDNSGTEFILGFTEMIEDSSDVLLYITTVKTSTINVQVTAPIYGAAVISETAFTISSGETKRITISQNIRMRGTQTDVKGVLITADDEISVWGFDSAGGSSDFFLALPTDVLGTNYFVLTDESSQSQVMLVGVSTPTIVTITLGMAIGGSTVTYEETPYGAGETFRLKLQRFDTFHFISQGDLSGTKIIADKNISVFNGNKQIVSGSNQYLVHTIEQVSAVKSWGQIFVVSPIPEQVDTNFLKFVASRDNTTVHKTCNDVPADTFHLTRVGETHSFGIPYSEICTIEADKPILVAQICQSSQNGLSMVLIPPVEQFGPDFTFTNPNPIDGPFESMLKIIVDDKEKSGLRIDGDVIPFPVVIGAVSATDYVICHISVSDGAHTVRHISPIVTFGGFIYGMAPNQLYATGAGFRVSPINTECKNTSIRAGDGLDNDCDGLIDEELCAETTTRMAFDDDGDGLYNEDCAKLAAVDGNWSSWGNYTDCSETCGRYGIPSNGTQTRTRTCSEPAPSNDGRPCKGSNTDYRRCNSTVICPESFNYTIAFMENANDAYHFVAVANIDSHVANITVVSKSGIVKMSALNASDTLGIEFGADFTVRNSDLSSRAIRILSDQNVLVQGFNRKDETPYMAGFVAREDTSLGNVYYALTFNDQIGMSTHPQILIVALTSGTDVNVLINVKNGLADGVEIENVFYGNEKNFNITMNSFETLQIQSEHGDFTGMRIQSDKPVSVFSGNKFFSTGSMDSHLVEQLPPVNTWGTKFVSVAPTYAAYFCKIVAHQAGTLVTYTCSNNPVKQSVSLDIEGSYSTLEFQNETCTFVSNNPVMIALFTPSTDASPWLIILQPLAVINGNLVFYVPEYADGAEFVFATQSHDYGHVTVECGNGDDVDELTADGMTSGHKSVGGGVHIIRTNGNSVLLTGYIHGWKGTSTFSYPLLVNSSLAEGNDAFVRNCGNGSSTRESETVSVAPSVTSTGYLSTPYNHTDLAETNILTNTVLSTASLYESIQSTLTSIDDSRSSLSISQTVLLTATMTETTQSSSTVPINITHTATVTASEQEQLWPDEILTTPLTDVTLPTVALTFTTQCTATLTASTQSPEVTMSSKCGCGNYSASNYTTEELQAIIAKLRSELLILKNTTSSYIRTKTSAKDSRPSAEAVGCVGCTILVLVGVGILVADASSLIEMIKTLKRNIFQRMP